MTTISTPLSSSQKAFDFNRFFRLVGTELQLNNIKHFLLIAAVLFVTSLILFSIMPPQIAVGLAAFIWIFCSIAAPLRMYPNLFQTNKGLTWSMLPASKAEKFASIFLQTVILTPILWYFVLLLSNSCGTYLNDLINPSTCPSAPMLESWNSALEIFAKIWAMQAGVLFCIMHFKEKKAQKTLLTFIVIGCSISLISTLISAGGHFLNWNLSWLQPIKDILNSKWTPYFTLAFAALMWVLSYIRMSRQQ